MATRPFEEQFPNWTMTWYALTTFYTSTWHETPACWADLEQSTYDSLLAINHRTQNLFIDVEWNDTRNEDRTAYPDGYRIGPTNTGVFRIRVIRDMDWDTPVEEHGIRDPMEVHPLLQELLARYA